PTTWFEELIAVAVPPPMLVRLGVRSCMPPAWVQRNACCTFVAVYDSPTTAPELLIPLAALKSPPREPSHCTPPDESLKIARMVQIARAHDIASAVDGSPATVRPGQPN